MQYMPTKEVVIKNIEKISRVLKNGSARAKYCRVVVQQGYSSRAEYSWKELGKIDANVEFGVAS